MIGRTISRYKVLEKLGEGGMGVVYRALDERLEREVALKFLPHNRVNDPEVKARFEREAVAAAALNHPSICTVYEVDEHEGEPFIAMEIVDGQTLSELIKDGPPPVEESVEIIKLAANDPYRQCRSLRSIGDCRLREEKHADAIAAFEKALERDSGMADAHTNLGFSLEQIGRTAEAGRHYQEALRLQPNDRLARFHYGRTLLEAGRPAEAVDYIAGAVEPLDERSAQILYTLADAQVRLGQVADAQGNLQVASRIAQETGQDELLPVIQQALGGRSR